VGDILHFVAGQYIHLLITLEDSSTAASGNAEVHLTEVVAAQQSRPESIVSEVGCISEHMGHPLALATMMS